MNENYDRLLVPINTDGQNNGCQSPFKLEIALSNEIRMVQNLKSYTLAELLISVAGIARSFHIMGMVCAIVTSQILYKKELI